MEPQILSVLILQRIIRWQIISLLQQELLLDEETANWIVVDCESVVIHLFRQEVRDYYKLEDIWNKKLRTSNENSIKED